MGRIQTFHQSHENYGSTSNMTATEEVVEEITHGQIYGGSGAHTGFTNVGLFSDMGIYTITMSDGTTCEVQEADLRQSTRKPHRFSCLVNGSKHKLKISQIQPCMAANHGGGVAGDGSGMLRVRSATPAGAMNVVTTVSGGVCKISPITFYPYYKIKIGESVKVLPYSILCSGKASRRFFRFRYDGTTITVRKNHIRPVTKHYTVILDGRVTEVACDKIQPYGDGTYLITYSGVERIVGSASVHSGVQDGAELFTDDEETSHLKKPLFQIKKNSINKEDEKTGRRFGLIKRYTKTTRGRRIRKIPRRKKQEKKELKIFDVSFCLCYQIIINGAQIVIPQHRIKQSKRHNGYMRFRYNKMVYYITPQTVTQAFYAPVVGYYSAFIDGKVVVVSGREMEIHPENPDVFIVRYNDEPFEVPVANITFLGEYVLEPDQDPTLVGGENGGEGNVSSPESSMESDTSDSDASVSGRDEIIEDANVYTTRTFVIHKKHFVTCYRIRLNGSEIVVPVSQVQPCKTRPGYLRVSYYGQTYIISQEDIELQYETEVTGFYSVTINSNPVILTGDLIDENPSDGTYTCFHKNTSYVVPQTMIMYIGDYPCTQAPNYNDMYGDMLDDSSEGDGEEEVSLGDQSDVSGEEPQMCIFVNEKPNMDITLPEPTTGSVMGWKVYIDGRFYTVPANRLKQLKNAPGFMEIVVNRKLYHVSIENIQPIMLPTVYFITIQGKPILVPSKDVRRHPTDQDYVIVRYRGQDYVIPITELKLADGSPVDINDIPMDLEYLTISKRPIVATVVLNGRSILVRSTDLRPHPSDAGMWIVTYDCQEFVVHSRDITNPALFVIILNGQSVTLSSRDIKPHASKAGFVIVKHRGREMIISASEIRFPDGSPVDPEALLSLLTVRKVSKKKREGELFTRACSPLCDKLDMMGGGDDIVGDSGLNPQGFAAMRDISDAGLALNHIPSFGSPAINYSSFHNVTEEGLMNIPCGVSVTSRTVEGASVTVVGGAKTKPSKVSGGAHSQGGANQGHIQGGANQGHIQGGSGPTAGLYGGMNGGHMVGCKPVMGGISSNVISQGRAPGSTRGSVSNLQTKEVRLPNNSHAQVASGGKTSTNGARYRGAGGAGGHGQVANSGNQQYGSSQMYGGSHGYTAASNSYNQSQTYKGKSHRNHKSFSSDSSSD